MKLPRRSFIKTAAGIFIPAITGFAIPPVLSRRMGMPMIKPKSASGGSGNTIVGPDGLTYGIITAEDGRQWLDRNLGATRVATASDDSQAYGHLYQWGRYCDGHQLSNSGTTSTLATTDTPGHANFIINDSPDYDWRSPKNDNLWQGLNGINNPCPAGFRLPTGGASGEWKALIDAAAITNAATAFSSSLKLPLAGSRYCSSADLGDQGSTGYYWSSTPSGAYAYDLFFESDSSSVYPDDSSGRAGGFSVRCVKD
jgi:uncharacterized protein (TIGR02145 family)